MEFHSLYENNNISAAESGLLAEQQQISVTAWPQWEDLAM